MKIILFVLLILLPLLILPYILKWNFINKTNKGLGITRKTCYIDEKGYLRWKSNNRLCHRDIAFWNNLHYGKGNRFSELDVHHKDGNKLNNRPENLQVLTRENHQIAHGKIIYEGMQKYIYIAKINWIKIETEKAILISQEWYPKSCCIFRNGNIYVLEDFLKCKK